MPCCCGAAGHAEGMLLRRQPVAALPFKGVMNCLYRYGGMPPLTLVPSALPNDMHVFFSIASVLFKTC